MRLVILLASIFPILPAPAAAPALMVVRQESELTSERHELARIRLLLGAERKYAEAKERLVVLAAELANVPGDDASALRAEVQGRLDEVRRALGEITTTGPSDEAQDRVDAAVRKAIEDGDFGFVLQIGPRAAASLAEAVRAQPDVLPSELGADPFYYLCYLAPSAASALCEELASEQGFFWKRRFLRALEEVGLTEKRLWATGQPGSFLAPGYLHVLERMASERDLTEKVLQLLPGLVERGALTPKLEAALVDGLQSQDSAVRAAAWKAGRSPSFEPVYVELLSHEDRDVRLGAAQAINETCPGNRALLERASDADAQMRAWVVHHLAGLPLDSWLPTDWALLARFLVDPDRDVYLRSARIVEGLPTATRSAEVDGRRYEREVIASSLLEEAFRRLTRSPEQERRLWVSTKLASLPAPLAFELSHVLVADADPLLVRSVVAQLADFWWEDIPESAKLLGTALANPSPERDRIRDQASGVLRAMGNSRVGMREIWRPIIGLGDYELLQWMLSGLNIRALDPVPAELMPELCAQVYAADPARLAALLPEPKYLTSFAPEQLQALADVARDATRPAGLRLLAVRSIPREVDDGAAWLENARALLADPFWRAADASRWSGWLAQVLERFESGERNALVLTLLQAPDLSVDLIHDAVWIHFSPTSPGGAEVAQLLLEKGYENEDEAWRNLASHALRSMGSAPAIADAQWILRAAHSAERDHRYAALNAIGELGDPAYLPLLEELLRTGESNTTQVANALSGYLSSEAGELLLVAATELSGEALERCLAHIEKIRAYQDARERWATRRTQGEVRAKVIAELVLQLDAGADETRVQAIRALATWEAVEAMPRLIELTSARSLSVAQAAREALDRLNTPPKD